MTRCQRRWLIVDTRTVDAARKIRRLRRGDGIVLLHLDLPRGARARLLARIRHLARDRQLTIVDGAGRDVARVHDRIQLRRALQARTPLIFLSPLFPTRSHPEWRPLARGRAAAFARLAGGRLSALGGMDARRYARIAPLGFRGWAGIDAF